MVRGTGRSRITVDTGHFVALQPTVNLLALSTEDRPGSWGTRNEPKRPLVMPAACRYEDARYS